MNISMHSREEREIATTSLGKKRGRCLNSADVDAGGVDEQHIVPPTKVARIDGALGHSLMPAPFFYYRDFSTMEDPDPLTPLTPPGRVPNFPAKMHAILSRPDLADLIAWLPHGRAWRVLKPREFETRVIPKYFEHSKFSSFIRQANGWGFRRITSGPDRNAYYHELFLRGIPHLCKQMKRPGVAQKVASDIDHEPDLYGISQSHPVPLNITDEQSAMVNSTVQGGPKARMPIYCGDVASVEPANSASTILPTGYVSATQRVALRNIPQVSVTASTSQPIATPKQSSSPPSSNLLLMPNPFTGGAVLPFITPNSNAAAASQFAAGFAAATALGNAHLNNLLLGQALFVSPQLDTGTSTALQQPVRQLNSKDVRSDSPVRMIG